MKNILLGFLLLLAPTALNAAPHTGFIEVSADHFNLLYAQGECARFLIELNTRPVHDGFRLELRATFTGVAGELVIADHGGLAFYASPALAAGTSTFIVRAHLVDTVRRDADRAGILQAEDAIAFWQDTLLHEGDPAKRVFDEEQIARFQAEKAALEHDLTLAEDLVDEVPLSIDAVPGTNGVLR